MPVKYPVEIIRPHYEPRATSTPVAKQFTRCQQPCTLCYSELAKPPAVHFESPSLTNINRLGRIWALLGLAGSQPVPSGPGGQHGRRLGGRPGALCEMTGFLFPGLAWNGLRPITRARVGELSLLLRELMQIRYQPHPLLEP